MSNFSADAKKGFAIGVGVAAALIVVAFATGVVKRTI